MGQIIELTTSDHHRLGAYAALPTDKPRGGVVVIQEVFGVTRHIRDVVDEYAGAGFFAIAPALFDRIGRDIEIPYTDISRAMDVVTKLKDDQTMNDIQAALDRVKSAGRLGVVGYCWGGTMAYLAACRLSINAAVSYYGGSTTRYLDEHPKCPVMYHFGEKDQHIPMSAVEQIKAADPAGIFHLYPADHGFNCTDRPSYEPASAKLAFDRSVEFFRRHIG